MDDFNNVLEGLKGILKLISEENLDEAEKEKMKKIKVKIKEVEEQIKKKKENNDITKGYYG